MTAERITVLIVDDHFLVRQGIVALLSTAPDIAVAGEASTGAEGIALHASLRPTVALIDLRLPDMEGGQVIRAIRQASPGARLIALSSYEGDQDIHAALEAGAATYLLKRSVQHDLLEAIRAAAAGTAALPDEVEKRLAVRSRFGELTAREREVLDLLARGRANKEIAVILDVSVNTVNTHVAHIIEKLGAEDRTHAVATAVRRGLVRLD